jgi:hypothetical protein
MIDSVPALFMLRGLIMKGPVTASLACSMLLATALAQDEGPHAGTWVLDVERSDMPDPATASRSETTTYRYENGEEIYTAEAVTMDGKNERQEYRGAYDGPHGRIRMTIDGEVVQDAPLQLRSLDPRTHLRIAMRPDGTLAGGIIVRRLSEDGKTLTSSILTFQPDGKLVNYQTRVFEKQE